MGFSGLESRWKLRDTTVYGLGACLAGLVTLTSVVAPSGRSVENDLPAPIISGESLPAMLNSADTHCDGQRPCSDLEFDALTSDLQRQWAITPQWIRLQCGGNVTLPSMESCIAQQTRSWLGGHPNRRAPWLDPHNAGSVVDEAVK